VPNKTLSVRDEDLPLWERAERVATTAGTSVSKLVATALIEKLGPTDTCRVELYNYEDIPYGHGKPGTPGRDHWFEEFAGRWLTNPPPDWETDFDRAPRPDREHWNTYVAETARGRIAVYARFVYPNTKKTPLFAVFNDIYEAQRALAGDERVDDFTLQHTGYKITDDARKPQIRWRDI
jgi:hypothetical protein